MIVVLWSSLVDRVFTSASASNLWIITVIDPVYLVDPSFAATINCPPSAFVGAWKLSSPLLTWTSSLKSLLASIAKNAWRASSAVMSTLPSIDFTKFCKEFSATVYPLIVTSISPVYLWLPEIASRVNDPFVPIPGALKVSTLTSTSFAKSLLASIAKNAWRASSAVMSALPVIVLFNSVKEFKSVFTNWLIFTVRLPEYLDSSLFTVIFNEPSLS